ncbi:MAG TPA: alpha/beta fold hydrolase [Telluria sp.]|jgi:pimeloyl-ACP methyl ester carboxylesterase
MKRVLSLAAFAALAVGSGATSAAAETDTQAAFARPQQMVDIGGRRLNLYCSGSGPVTVVFDSPAGDAGWSWFKVQPQVARRTRACVYDRAGLGFSDPSPRPGTAGNAVDDLHRLLQAAGIAAPYVMVGNSYGGGIVQLYTYRFPAEVKGLVLVEAQHEDETARLNRASGGKLQAMYDMLRANEKSCVDASVAGFVAGSELWNNCIGPLPAGRGRALAAAELAHRSTAGYWRAAHSENTSFDVGDAELRAARRSFGDLPLVVLSRGVSPYAVPGKPQSRLNKAMEDENLALHKEMAALSTRGQHRVVAGAGHIIQFDQPDAVTGAISAILDELQR